MELRRKIQIGWAAVMIGLMPSCMPPNQANELKEKYAQVQQENADLLGANESLTSDLNEAKAKIDLLNKEMVGTQEEKENLKQALERVQYEFDQLREINEELMNQSNRLSSGSEAENRKMMAELMVLQEQLQSKEDSLLILQSDLNKQQNHLNALDAELNASLAQLKEREARVQELEGMIAAKDSAMNALKDKVKEALLGFADKGIAVEERNGRIYVSMEAKLLFASGSTEVGAEGQTAVIQLAKVLESEKDLSILVEGHTDSDPIKSARIKDNWDLSVMRATSVVRIMKDNSQLDPTMIIAAGRGETMPIAPNDNAANKAKNRRIEVILTPNLDALMEFLNE